MSDSKRIAKNTFFLYFRMLLIMGVSLYTSRVVLKILGVDDFGIYNVVGGIVAMFSFLNGSLSSATSRYITFELGRKDCVKLNKVFNTALLIHLLIALSVVILAETAGLWFFYEKMIIPADRMNAAFWVFQISVFTSFFSLTQVPYNATIIAYEDMKIYAYIGVFEAVAKLAIVYLLLVSPIDRLIFYALLLCLLQIGIMIFYRFYCNRRYEICRINFPKDMLLFREMFSYGCADLMGNLSVMAQGQGLNLLLNVFFGPAVNAARAIVYQVQGAITQFSNNFMTAVKPQIIKLYAAEDTEGMLRLVSRSSCLSYYLMWMIAFPICLEARYVLNMWLGEYPEHTVNFLYLVIMLCLIQTLKTPRSTVFHATGHIKRVNLIVGSILCAALPLAYLLLKLGREPESVFWAANASMLVSEFAGVIILKRYVEYSPLSYLLNVHGRCLLVTAVSFVVPYLIYDRWMDTSFTRLVVTCLTTSISVILTSYVLGLDKVMRTMLNDFIAKKIFRNG